MKLTSAIALAAVLSTSLLSASFSQGSVLYKQGQSGVPDVSETRDKMGYALTSGDYNGDGFRDLAIGIPGENSDMGMVLVLRGTKDGLTLVGRQHFSQTSISHFQGDHLSEAGDLFAAALTSGDFNGDSFDDLAIGTPGETLHGVVRAGAMSVVYGSASGLNMSSGQFTSLDSEGAVGTAQTNDSFGAAMAVGNFDADAYDDLAVGIPGRTIGGMVHVFYGSGDGISMGRDVNFKQGPAGSDYIAVSGTSRDNERFGFSLSVGRYDSDVYSDLAIGVPFDEHPDGIAWTIAGGVHMLFGSASGLSTVGSKYWTEQSPGTPRPMEAGDELGRSLTSGRFNGDERDDLAVGVPGKRGAGGDAAGMVAIIYGTDSKALIGTQIHLTSQGQGGILDTPEQGDNWGAAMASGNFLNDESFLAVAAPDDSVNGAGKAGLVTIDKRNEHWLINQDSDNVPDSSETNDEFGSALYADDFNGDGYPDLVVGVASENEGAISDSGVVHVLYWIEDPLIFKDGFENGTVDRW